MPGEIIAQVAFQCTDTLARDQFENTWYFVTSGSTPTTGDYESVASVIENFWNLAPTGHAPSSYLSPCVAEPVVIKMYDQAAAKPRPIGFQTSFPRAASSGSKGLPEQIALCLSYQAASNTPRHRGRLYLGPWNDDANVADTLADGALGFSRPSEPFITSLVTAATALQATTIGGITWCLRSTIGTGTPTAPVNEYEPIQHGHVDNEWDGQRRRRIAASYRLGW